MIEIMVITVMLMPMRAIMAMMIIEDGGDDDDAEDCNSDDGNNHDDSIDDCSHFHSNKIIYKIVETLRAVEGFNISSY